MVPGPALSLAEILALFCNPPLIPRVGLFERAARKGPLLQASAKLFILLGPFFRFNDIVRDIALGQRLAKSIDEQADANDFIEGAPAGHRAVGVAVTQKTDDLIGDLARS